ncbi:MAG: hypothetical protein R2824_11625 [Saprospiraceae bacterium]|nr:hypothetical protein [Lewinella sp.]
MKTLRFFAAWILGLIVLLSADTLLAQQTKIDYFRPYDQNGVNVFEAPNESTVPFDGLAVKIGANFTQQYQMLKHSNESTLEANALYPLGNGFNLATANLNINVQLDDGIRVALENYMSSRHHSEFWVKGGYIQIDKLPMFNNPQWFTDLVRIKIGHMQINYGDQQFRRTDNGNAIYNPFVGNYIMDAFATEIGGEVYLFPTKNITAALGMTAGLIKGDVKDYAPGETSADRQRKDPSIYLKLAYDNQVSSDLRLRLSGSLYTNGNTPRNTLYGGDRTGSRFYEVMKLAAEDSPFSGRLNPGFSNKITAFQINPFIKFKGLEFFGTYEQSSGKTNAENDTRNATQVAGELIYRFLPREQAYIGARYNTVTAELSGVDDKVSIDRTEIAAGWFATKNLLLKLGYVNQNYTDFPDDESYGKYYNGNFNGMMIEAIIGF